MVARWKPVRQILQASLDTLPDKLRMLVKQYYFGSGGRSVGETFLPSPQLFALYNSKAIAASEKAHLILGYKPRFNFQRGMVLTGCYLEWAYKDIRQSTLRERNDPLSENKLASTDFTKQL